MWCAVESGLLRSIAPEGFEWIHSQRGQQEGCKFPIGSELATSGNYRVWGWRCVRPG
jgi:hypothetical protein